MYIYTAETHMNQAMGADTDRHGNFTTSSGAQATLNMPPALDSLTVNLLG